MSYSMVDFFANLSQETITILLSLCVSIITTLLVHFLSYPKLILEEKAKLIGTLTQKKIEGISALRDSLCKLNVYEDLSLTEPPETIIPEMAGTGIYTPAVFYDYKNFTDTLYCLENSYNEYKSYISLRAAMHIIYIKAFFWSFFRFCKENDISEDLLRWLSVPLYKDLKKVYQKIDAILICELNHLRTKYHPKYGLIYNFYLSVYNFAYRKSKIYKYVNDSDSIMVKFINTRRYEKNINKAKVQDTYSI